jgi:hypothetical protein
VSPTRQPRLGSVVWAEVKDVNGFAKVRPLAIVTPTAEIAPGKTLRVQLSRSTSSNPIS